MKIGYDRKSTSHQKDDIQVDALQKAGCEKIFPDVISGATAKRPQLEKMFEQLRPGDIVIVYDLFRFGRSVKDLIDLIDRVHNCGAEFKCIKQPLIDTTTIQGKMLFYLNAIYAEMERYFIRYRTKDGLESARARGHYGGRPKADEKAVKKALKLYHANVYSISEISKLTGIGKSTLYKYLHAEKERKK